MSEKKKGKPGFFKSCLGCLGIIVILGIVIGGCSAIFGGDDEKSLNKPEEKSQQKEPKKAGETSEEKAAAEKKEKEEAEAKVKEDSVPREHKSALKKAESYAEAMSMSKASIYDQLTSEYGENFPKEAAQYAIDNIVFDDWKENALKKARSYADDMDMSDSAIYDQLISENGEQFTPEEAKYAIDNL